MRRPVLILPLVLMTCSSPPAGSLRVQVNVEPGLGSRCARVVARGTGQRESSPVVLAGRSSFVIGIAQEQEVQEVTLQAQGYSDEGCTTLSVPPETSELLATRFTTPTSAVMLTLRLSSQRSDGGVDADGDGFGPGLDCDDTNAAVHPDAVESCTNSLDDDCNDLVDCAEPACSNEACGVSGQCTDKVCRAPSEAGLCSDNLDNDGDGALDCADSDCPAGQPCSDANACTRSDVCGGGSCSGTALVCDSPPSRQCFASAGSCGAGGVCAYTVTTGACNDGLACTQNDVCAADGSCTGTPRVCNTPPGQCSVAVGQCSETQGGTCVYPSRTGSCDDQDSCTRDDQCAADGTCAGTRVSCTPPGECFTATCVAGGGCQFTVRAGSCSGGTCNAAGNCVPAVAPFPITPSNFSPGQLPPSAGTVVVSCDVTIDTSGASVGWSTCTGGPAAPQSSVVNDVMLLHFDALTIGAGATVRAVGARPLIIAVRGAVVIDGTLTASSAGARGAGSEVACSSGVGEDGRASGNPQNGGGAGGGGFGTNGGKGGEGDEGGDEGDRGNSNGNGNLTPLRGGCRGGSGGRAGNGSGAGGRGGGAVQVTAGGTLTVNSGATLSAQGEGGRGGFAHERAGGGGGGSGGALFLEAGTLVIQGGAGVVANGGAGGEGSGITSGGDGQGGQRSETGAWPSSLTCGGNGGSGGAREDGAGNGRDPNCGDDLPGGGGGGGVGRIRFNAINSCAVSPWAVLSPEPSASANCR